MTTDVRGRFVWHQLQTTDPSAAKKFYTSITSWTVDDRGEGPTAHAMWMANGAPVGDLVELAPRLREMKVPPQWISFIGTPDVDATIALATKLGGRVWNPGGTADVGRWAILGDPSGAVFAVFTPAGALPVSDAMPTPGEFAWHELATKDLAQAVEFYGELFGWAEASVYDMGEMGPYRIFSRTKGSPPIGGMFQPGAKMPVPPHWLPYAHVTGVDTSAEAITKGGGRIVNGPIDVPGGDRVVIFDDPQGAAFALHQTGMKSM